MLLASLVLWLLLWRVRALFLASLIESTWSFGESLVMVAGAWVLFAAFATDWDRQRLGFATGERRMAEELEAEMRRLVKERDDWEEKAVVCQARLQRKEAGASLEEYEAHLPTPPTTRT